MASSHCSAGGLSDDALAELFAIDLAVAVVPGNAASIAGAASPS